MSNPNLDWPPELAAMPGHDIDRARVAWSRLLGMAEGGIPRDVALAQQLYRNARRVFDAVVHVGTETMQENVRARLSPSAVVPRSAVQDFGQLDELDGTGAGDFESTHPDDATHVILRLKDISIIDDTLDRKEDAD